MISHSSNRSSCLRSENSKGVSQLANKKISQDAKAQGASAAPQVYPFHPSVTHLLVHASTIETMRVGLKNIRQPLFRKTC